MTLNDFIKDLQKLQSEGHGDVEVMACHGGSGAIDPASHAFLRESDGTENGEPCEWPVGTPYIEVYIGN